MRNHPTKAPLRRVVSAVFIQSRYNRRGRGSYELLLECEHLEYKKASLWIRADGRPSPARVRCHDCHARAIVAETRARRGTEADTPRAIVTPSGVLLTRAQYVARHRRMEHPRNCSEGHLFCACWPGGPCVAELDLEVAQ